MDAERWREVDRVFAAALEKEPAAREEYLRAACAHDAALRVEVDRLLDADRRAARFLEAPAGGAVRLIGEAWNPGRTPYGSESQGRPLEGERRDDEGRGGEGRGGTERGGQGRAGERLGPYRLLSRIGGGAAGTVYLACRDDDAYRRRVAIKILRAELEGTEASHRFLVERHILARLEHPNIARLYDAGSTGDGRPFLVMELIEGLPLDVHCERHRLTVDQRLDLFRQVCAAVDHAHRNLLVHRDIKPANILVTAAGEPRLLDFGIAKQLAPAPDEPAGVTRTGLRLLTPSYASPEQVRGEPISTASDVYSLGVVLFELLAGRSPYRLAGGLPHEVERAICEQEPERPSQALWRPPGAWARRELPAAETAAARRTTPQALSRRLRGDLDNIVLAALRKEPQRRYDAVSRLSQDIENHQRNRPVSARADTLPYRARKFVRRHRAGVAAGALAALLAVAALVGLVAQERRLARETKKARYALSFLVDTFRGADPYHTPGRRLGVPEILDAAAGRVARELNGQPDSQATLLRSLGEVDLGLGRYEQAQPLLERALALSVRLSGEDSLDTAAALDLLGDLRHERSDPAGAEVLLRRSLAIKRRLMGNRRLEVARTLNRLGEVVAERGALPAAEALHREALGIARAVESPPGLTVAASTIALAKLAEGRGSYAAAADLYRQGLALDRRALGSADPRLYRDQSDYAEVLLNLGRYAEAERLLRASLAAQTAMIGRDHPDTATTLDDLAMALHQQGRYAEAEALDREVLALARGRYGRYHWRVAAVLGNLAAALQAQDKMAEAIPFLTEALDVRRRTLGENDPLVGQALLLLAGARREAGEPAAALAQASQALAILSRREGAEHPHVAYAEREIGKDYLALRQFPAAEEHLRRSLDIRRKTLRADHPEVARAKAALAGCLVELRRFDEADGLLGEAEATLAGQYGAADARVAGVRAQRARLGALRAAHVQ